MQKCYFLQLLLFLSISCNDTTFLMSMQLWYAIDIYYACTVTKYISLGKPRTDNIYCKVVLGDQEQQTDVARETLASANQNQKGVPQIPVLIWNYSMQFHVKNIEEEVLIFTVYESCLYTPDGKLKVIYLNKDVLE